MFWSIKIQYYILYIRKKYLHYYNVFAKQNASNAKVKNNSYVLDVQVQCTNKIPVLFQHLKIKMYVYVF